ncbi:hypothetical protein [Burkholderia multivorans]|uniref:hypothetical protein n=1 Tax=Burkholderia multivorans TaxID=87883 RepID=UPI00286FB22A|nr:hypothetical protein [Burkholderia multivorans]
MERSVSATCAGKAAASMARIRRRSQGGGKYIALNAPFFGATVSSLSFSGPVGQTSYTLEVSAGCRWNGNVSVRNNTTGGVIVLPWNGSLWSVASGDGSLIRTSTTDSFTFLPST